jgi:hypothetical protein
MYESRARHGRLATDQHCTGPAHLFKTIGFVGHGRGGIAKPVDRLFRDVAQGNDYIHARPEAQIEFFSM